MKNQNIQDALIVVRMLQQHSQMVKSILVLKKKNSKNQS